MKFSILIKAAATIIIFIVDYMKLVKLPRKTWKCIMTEMLKLVNINQVISVSFVAIKRKSFQSIMGLTRSLTLLSKLMT